MSDTAVIFNVLARDRASRVFRNVAASARESSSAVALAFGPAVLPAMGAATAAAVGFGAAMAGVGAAAGVYKAVFSSTFEEVKTAGDEIDKLNDKVELLGQQAKMSSGKEQAAFLKQQAAAAEQLRAKLALLPPEQRAVVMQYQGMKATWDKFVDANKPQTYGVMTAGFRAISTIIPKLQPLFNMASAAAFRFVHWLERAAAGGGIDKLVKFLTGQAGPAIDNLAIIGRNAGIVIGAAFSSLAPTGQGLLAWLAEASGLAANFAAGGGFERFVGYLDSNGPNAVSLLANIATTLGTVLQAVTPLAPLSLAVASALSAIIAAIPPPVLTALIGAWIAFSVAMKGYHAAVLVVGVATKGAAAAQFIWNGAVIAANFVRATAQIAGFVTKQVALKVATAASAAAQAAWNAAVVAGNFVRATAQIAAYLAKQLLVSAATKAWAAIQWVLNAAFWASPITWIVAGIVALIAVIVLIATKTDWFQRLWKWAWTGIKNAASAAWTWIRQKTQQFWTWISGVPGRIRDRWNGIWASVRTRAAGAFSWVRGKIQTFYSWVTSLPGKVSSKMRGMFAGLWMGFKSAANNVIRGWNNLSFGIPGFSVMGVSVPGFSVGTPDIPYLAKGGNITGAGTAIVGERGPELVHLNRGAQVEPLSRSGRGAQEVVVVLDLRGADSEFGRLLLHTLRTSSATASGVRAALKIRTS